MAQDDPRVRVGQMGVWGRSPQSTLAKWGSGGVAPRALSVKKGSKGRGPSGEGSNARMAACPRARPAATVSATTAGSSALHDLTVAAGRAGAPGRQSRGSVNERAAEQPDHCCSSTTAVRVHDLGMHGCSDTASLPQQSGYCNS